MYKQLKYPPEAKILLDIISREGRYQLDNVNPAILLELANQHDITPLVFDKLKEYKPKIPQDIYADLKYCYLFNLAKNRGFWNEFLKINQEFRQKNISFVPIKGMDILTRIYPELDLRSLSDIDILIKEKEFNLAQNLLYRMGYQKRLDGLKENYWKQEQCHIKFYKEPFLVEIHWGLDFKRGRMAILPRLWERTREITIDNHRIITLSAEDAFFAFALHLRRFGNILALKQILDTARIINQSSGFDWDYVLEESRRGKMRATIYFILTQTKLFTSANIPEDFFIKLGLASWRKRLIERFISTHTFQIRPSFKNNYLKAHMLLYDNLGEPIYYLIKIPYEQFCKFYDLRPYGFRANLFYHMRFLYIPFKQILYKWVKKEQK